MKWFKKEAAAPTDESLSVLEDLLDEEYDTVEFDAWAGACRICKGHDGEVKSLDDVIDETEHDAPVYSWSHIGCKCYLIVMGPDLDNVRVDYNGRV